MSLRLLRVTSRIGQAITYATVAVSALVAMASMCINTSCMPEVVKIDVASTQPMTVEVKAPADPVEIVVMHGEIDSPLARYRWLAISAGGTAIVALPILAGWWHVDKKRRKS